MTTALEDSVLHLPMKERAHLALLLLQSLDELPEAEAQQLWLQEAARRADEIDAGTVRLVSGEELEAQVLAQFK